MLFYFHIRNNCIPVRPSVDRDVPILPESLDGVGIPVDKKQRRKLFKEINNNFVLENDR